MTQDQLLNSQQSLSDMGLQGELFALAYECKRLPSFLHDKIVHLGHYEISRGYDILSYEDSNSILPDRYIEVKTFRGHPHFFWTDNEIAAARKYGSHYYLYLIDIDKISTNGNNAQASNKNSAFAPNSGAKASAPNSEVAVLGYEPTIIPNPALLFNNNSQWTFQVQQYAFTLLSNEQIPTDWDSSTILLGCYNNEDHLKWILSHNLYNVRSQKDAPGAVTLTNPLVQQARYLLLYSVANPRVFMLYALASNPYKVTKTEMLAQGYPNPHAFSYILHPIQRQLDSFHIDLTTLLREVNHTSDRTYGTPLYLNGTQLRRFMVDNTITTPHISPTKRYPDNEDSFPTKVADSVSKHGLPWSSEEDATLLSHLQNHTPIAEISPFLNRTPEGVKRRMGRLRKANKISFNLYMHYYNNDPVFNYHRRVETNE